MNRLSLAESRPLRFVLAGGLNTLFGYGVFLASLGLGFGATWSLTISTVLGIAFNFLTTGSLAFGSRDLSRAPAFVLTYAGLYLINLALLKGLAAAGVALALAQAALLLPMAVLSYLIQRDFVFAKRGNDGDLA